MVHVPCRGSAQYTHRVEYPIPVPIDILFVIDNSDSMQDEIVALRSNVDLMVRELVSADVDTRVGVITADVNCNLPTKTCSGGVPNSCCSANPDVCEDKDTDGDGKVDASNCDGGRLRASSSGRRVFSKPTRENQAQWAAEFDDLLGNLGNSGAGFGAGLEAMRRAVGCSLGADCDASDRAVAELNAGFVRPDAILAVVFVSDEDDCSVMDRTIYDLPQPAADPAEQGRHFCSPRECYANRAPDLDQDGDGLIDWADPDADGFFTCPDGALDVPRVVNPPTLEAVETYVDWLIAAKRGPALVRVAISGGVNTTTNGTMERSAAGCVSDAGTASENCGCWSEDGDPLYCAVTEASGGRGVPYPTEVQPAGCTAMPATRYVRFLNALETRTAEAGVFCATFTESICEGPLQGLFAPRISLATLSRCYELAHPVLGPEHVIVRLNGEELSHADRSGGQRGWYLVGDRTVCLTGDAEPGPGDVVEIVYYNFVCSTEE